MGFINNCYDPMEKLVQQLDVVSNMFYNMDTVTIIH